MAYGVNAPFGLRPVSSITGGSWTEKTNVYHIYSSEDGATTYDGDIFNGDPVMWQVTDPVGRPGTNTIERATIYNEYPPVDAVAYPILGVFQSCEYTTPDGKLVQSPYWPASTIVQAGSEIKAYVIDDPSVVWEIQVSTAINDLATARFGYGTEGIGDGENSEFGQNFTFGLGGGGDQLVPNNPESGNTRTGQSAIYLNNSSGNSATTRSNATLPLKAIGFSLNTQNLPIYEPEPGTSNTRVRAFLNVRVIINNHVFSGGTIGRERFSDNKIGNKK